MSKRASSLDNLGQLTLPFDRESVPRQLAGEGRTKEAIREALKSTIDNCPLDRAQIAAELSRLTGDCISEHVINTWVAESKSDRRFPLEYSAALVIITGNPCVLRAALRGAGLHLITSDEKQLLELGRLTAEEMKQRKRKRAVMEVLGL